MKSFLFELRSSVMAVLVLALVCCGAYPLAVYLVAQMAFQHKANGSLITDKSGAIRGSVLIGQPFAAGKYFHPRPSAAGAGYDGLSSGGSNLGPTSQKLSDSIKDRVAQYRKENGLKDTDPVPADAATASGSGLDPHISAANAELQTARVARACGLSPEQLRVMVRQNTDQPDLGFLGEPGVNVLKLNLALDAVGGAR